MYVIFPAEDLVELTLCRPPVPPTQRSSQGSPSCPTPASPPSPSRPQTVTSKSKKDKEPNLRKKKLSKQEQEERYQNMASASGEGCLRELSHPSLNDHLKNHNAVTFKLVRTVSDFSQELSQMYEQHAEELQLLVANFRKKNAELRKERPACSSSLFLTWETLLQEVEVDSQAHSDIASVFGRQVSRPLLERSFHRKVQARKVFAHRENFESVITKAEEKLAKARQDYKASYLGHMASPSNSASLSAYLDAHNNYVTQLHATNNMVETYTSETLPLLLQELEEVYSDLCTTLSDSVLQGAEVISSRATEQSRRYESLAGQCRSVAPPSDLMQFVRCLSPLPPQPHPSHRLRLFTPPQPPHPEHDPSMADAPPINPYQDGGNVPAPLKNELVVDRLASVSVRSRYEALRLEAAELESQIKQLQDSLDTMARIQQRSMESQLYNKVNELQEDISAKRFELRTSQIHLAAVRAQRELFASKLDVAEGASGRDRKMSSSSTGSMKSKWLTAFKSLKKPSTPSNGTSPKEEKKNGRDAGLNLGLDTAHQFQEYTYKKITPCDVCSQVLRGHTRQGLKCRVCKLNVHVDCQEKVGRCQAKSRLLRRQKSTSEIETRVTPAQDDEAVSLVANRPGRSSVSPAAVSQGGSSPSPRTVTWKTPPSRNLALSELASPEVDTVYQVLKQAGEISSSRPVGPPPARRPQPPLALRGATTLSVGPAPHASSSDHLGALPLPSADAGRRRRLFSGVRSLSVFGNRSSQGRSISLPEKAPQYAAGTRPFGQPLVLGATQENGNASAAPSPLPQKRGSNKKR